MCADRAEFVAASFNVHAGIDGWGRPHDVLGLCRRLDADVLVAGSATFAGAAGGYAANIRRLRGEGAPRAAE